MTELADRPIPNPTPDRRVPRLLSSTRWPLVAGALLACGAVAVAATWQSEGQPAAPAAVPMATYASPGPDAAIGPAVNEWNRLRQSDNLPFADYARFLMAHTGWPGEAAMRRAAERQLKPDQIDAATVAAYFTRFEPTTVAGRTRQAEALRGLGRTAEANAAARAAWVAGPASSDDEARLFAFFNPVFTPEDQDRRMEVLLWARATASAERQLARVASPRRALYAARLAMLSKAPGAGALQPALASDAGFVVDRAMWLRDGGQSVAARNWLAGPMQLSGAPIAAEPYLDALLIFAQGAANDNQGSLAYGIAQKADFAFAPGTAVRERPLAERDPYTSLVWLGGDVALRKLNRPRDAAAMFQRYARAALTPSTQTKGLYWAARSLAQAGDAAAAQALFTEAAGHGDTFYGQLAAERLGRAPGMPPAPPATTPDPTARAAFDRSDLVRAARWLGSQGRWADQTTFLRQIAANAKTQTDHLLAVDLSRSIGRPDLGVMVARNARLGTADPVRFGFPQIAVPGPAEPLWTMVHAISRQESMFDREATSRVGAKGLMQLMPATAREQAGKIGLPYDYDRLTRDPQYNLLLGSSFYKRLLDSYGGSHVLAVAAYNAGPGNVRKFINANGDPRMPGVDVLQWIEAIPLTETRGYVQRVLENAVVYDALNPARARMPAQNRLSAYLGKRTAG
ncbi:lytic transglycosylase domain-containing protein [Sphingomonas jatrophae]|uniref:Soluble lytic murein transglycosylase n=1 Tax=Sphingomonas jatrophae TaxID=1166337 RepID=A0A1I6M373_9SPHN|nr:lytic transglycosylase domain-containing protein [Sphingomonas jatrophae]SFS10129.1 soluble lytic murein transglycosylase [Sphingomonas jatrophae]